MEVGGSLVKSDLDRLCLVLLPLVRQILFPPSGCLYNLFVPEKKSLDLLLHHPAQDSVPKIVSKVFAVQFVVESDSLPHFKTGM